MRKSIKCIALLFALVLLFALTACGKTLEGTYTAVGITLTFDGDTFRAEKGDAVGSGTYEIIEGEEETRIFFTFLEGEGSYTSTFGSILFAEDGVRFEQSESYVKIAGIPFAKKTAE